MKEITIQYVKVVIMLVILATAMVYVSTPKTVEITVVQVELNDNQTELIVDDLRSVRRTLDRVIGRWGDLLI